MDLFEEWNATENSRSDQQLQQQQPSTGRRQQQQQLPPPPLPPQQQQQQEFQRGRNQNQPGSNNGGGILGSVWGQRQQAPSQPTLQQTSASPPTSAPATGVSGSRFSANAGAQSANPFATGASASFTSNPFASANPFGVGPSTRVGAGSGYRATGSSDVAAFGDPSRSPVSFDIFVSRFRFSIY